MLLKTARKRFKLNGNEQNKKHLCALLSSRGLFSEAEPLQKDSYEILKRSLGPEHFDTLSALGNWAATLDKLGRTAQAEPLNKELYEIPKRTLGPEHPDTLRAFRNWEILKKHIVDASAR